MVILKTLNKEFDITKYVDRPYHRNGNIVGLEDTAVITLPSVNKNAFKGIDLSRKIPLNSVVEITTIEGLKQYYVESSTVELINGKLKLYSHSLNLIEPKYITKLIPIPDYANTQPANVAEYYINESSKVLNTQLHGMSGGYDNFIDFAISQVSNDTSVINGRTVLEDGEYNINFSIGLGRINGFIAPRISTFYAELYTTSFGTKEVLFKQDFGSYGGIGWPMVGTKSFSTTLELTAGTELGVMIYINGFAAGGETPLPMWLNVSSGYLNIDKVEQLESESIYVDELVEKLLTLPNITALSDYKLDPSSKAMLSTILAYDEVHTEPTLYDALERVASYIKARLYIDLENDKKVVRYVFYEDMSKLPYVEPNDNIVIKNQVSNDYASALALKNNNVIRDNILVELLTVRSVDDNTSRITTDNIGIRSRFSQDRIKMVKVKGKEIKDTNGNTILNANDYLDITPNVIEKAYYDTLDKMVDYNNRLINNQNNHIYFVRGENKLFGMSSIGAQFESWIPNNSNRAIYETMATVLQRNNPNITIEKFIDNGLDDDVNLEFELSYYPMSQSHAYILKDDQSGFEERVIQRLNANDRVNNVDYLGDYARTKVNSIGGTEINRQSIAKDIDGIIDIGTVSPDNERVVNITALDYEDFTQYFITYVKDYVFQSHYIGIDSDRRLVHVPKDEFVKRVDKSINTVVLMRERETTNESVVEPNMFMKFLENNHDYLAPKTALLTLDGKKITTLLDVGATANTIEWYFEMIDNFNAGNKVSRLPDNAGYYQHGVPYSNIFGRLFRAVIEFYENQDNTLNSKMGMPDGDFTDGVKYSDFQYIIEKDAREQFALSVQTSIISDNDTIYVYNGIGKYNDMSNHTPYNIDIAILDYRPNRDDKYIDFGRITPQINNTKVFSGHFETTLTEGGEGFAYYERNTGELILAVVGGVNSGVNTIYFKGETYGKYSFLIKPHNLYISAGIGLEQESESMYQGTFNYSYNLNMGAETSVYKGVFFGASIDMMVYGGTQIETAYDYKYNLNISATPEVHKALETETFIDMLVAGETNINTEKAYSYNISIGSSFETANLISSVGQAGIGCGFETMINGAKNFNKDLDVNIGVNTMRKKIPTVYYKVTWRRRWDYTFIKTDTVASGEDATFPTNSQINYGSGYEADGFIGDYTNVTSDRTILVNRKEIPKNPTWQLNRTMPPSTICQAPLEPQIGKPCTSIGETRTVGGFHDGYDGCIELICKI